MINYDLENSPLQIRINGLPGGTAQVGVKFFDAGGMDAGGVFLKFSFPLQYQLGNCTNWTNVSTGASPATSEVWTITVKRISDEKRVVITSNDNDVLDLVLVLHETCKDNSWETSWSRDVEKIMFSSPYDTAEDSYRRSKNTHFDYIQNVFVAVIKFIWLHDYTIAKYLETIYITIEKYQLVTQQPKMIRSKTS